MSIEVINLVINIILVLFIVVLAYLYYRNFTVDPDDEESKTIDQLIQETVSGVGEKLKEELQVEIHNSIVETLYAEENLANVKSLLTSAISESIPDFTQLIPQILAETLPQIAPMSFAAESSSKEEIQDAKDNAGAVLVNSLLDQIPFLDMAGKNFLGEDWKEQAQGNPKAFMLMIQQLQNLGILDYIQSMAKFDPSSLLKQNVSGSTNTPTKSSKSGYQ